MMNTLFLRLFNGPTLGFITALFWSIAILAPFLLMWRYIHFSPIPDDMTLETFIMRGFSQKNISLPADPLLLSLLFIFLGTIAGLLSRFVAHLFEDACSKARESIYWVFSVIFERPAPVMTFFAMLLFLLFSKSIPESIHDTVVIACLLTMVLLPFAILKVDVLSAEGASRWWPLAWPGWLSIMLIIFLQIISLTTSFVGTLLLEQPHIFGIAYVAGPLIFISEDILFALMIVIFLFRLRLGDMALLVKSFFAPRFLGKLLVISAYMFVLFLLCAPLVVSISGIHLFVLPPIELGFIKQGGDVPFFINLFHTLYDNMENYFLFIAIPVEIFSLLAFGRFIVKTEMGDLIKIRLTTLSDAKHLRG